LSAARVRRINLLYLCIPQCPLVGELESFIYGEFKKTLGRYVLALSVSVDNDGRKQNPLAP
jgi:hypothetical protein